MHDEIETSSKAKEKDVSKSHLMKKLSVSLDGTIHVDTLKEFIESTIKDKVDRATKTFNGYAKPYTTGVYDLKIRDGYQSPKFQQFIGKGNHKQHIGHFVEMCNDVGTIGDLLVKQFFRSLKGNVFDWYADFEPSSIDSLEQLVQEFFNHFYSMRWTISMTKFQNAHQWKDELVVDFIVR